MTNFKLKLTFLVLYALLTADFVASRPYNDDSNNTELVNITSPEVSGDTYKIPIDPNSDTLVVANAEEISRKTSDSDSKTQMESIMNAEQSRDENLSKKVIKDPRNVLNISKADADSLNNQLKVSSPVLEDIIDAETGREESMTDILFRSESELEEVPSFEFLIGVKPNNTDILVKVNKSVNFKDLDGILSERTGNGSEPFRKIDYVELVEVVKQDGENKSAYNLANMTGHEIDNDNAPDTSFTDVQTLFMACFGTLLPLLAILCVTLIVRCVCRRWCRRRVPSSVSDSSEHKHAHQQKSSTGEENSGGGGSADNSGPANGSIITMTLKNNHLIVETEERNDIMKNGRETKMKYSPENDGIFVVEVQQSAVYRSNNNKSLQNSPPHDPQISTNQAQIHRVPEELENIEEKNSGTDSSNPEEASEKESVKIEMDKPLALSSTGLSISDLSVSSIGSHNASYSYGSQVGYEHGPFGYPIYAGYDIPKGISREGIIHDNSREPLIAKTPTDHDKPVVTAAILKQDSIIGNDILKGTEYCIEGCSDGPLLSDILAREVSLQQLHDKMDKTFENGTAVLVEKSESPRKTLNRADSLPVRLENESANVVAEKTAVMEMIIEDDVLTMNKDSLKSKRASLPMIRTDMYESVKDSLAPSGSPKFERRNNDVSPGEYNAPPMITITEENDTSMNSEELVS